MPLPDEQIVPCAKGWWSPPVTVAFHVEIWLEQAEVGVENLTTWVALFVQNTCCVVHTVRSIPVCLLCFRWIEVCIHVYQYMPWVSCLFTARI